jgi:hypothetical protein
MTRNLGTKFDEIHDEIAQAFEDLVPAGAEKGECSLSFLKSISDFVLRVETCVSATYKPADHL